MVRLLPKRYRLNPFTVFIHVHFQTLFQTARSALVSVSLVDRTATLHGDRERERQKNNNNVTTVWWILLCLSDSFGHVILPEGQSPGERLCCYPVVIALLPRSSSQASFPQTSVLSRCLLRKCAPSITLGWITPAPLPQQCSAQLLMAQSWQN